MGLRSIRSPRCPGLRIRSMSSYLLPSVPTSSTSFLPSAFKPVFCSHLHRLVSISLVVLQSPHLDLTCSKTKWASVASYAGSVYRSLKRVRRPTIIAMKRQDSHLMPHTQPSQRINISVKTSVLAQSSTPGTPISLKPAL